MYIIYSGNAKQYASAARTVREGKRTLVVATYLGRVVEKWATWSPTGEPAWPSIVPEGRFHYRNARRTPSRLRRSYTSKESSDIFDPEFVHTIDISISEEDLSDLLAHPIDKTKYKSDVVIDGETVHEVSFSTKGTSSLVLASKKPDNSRYNFKIKFGRFVEGQTWHSLHELSLQGSFADATYMKDHLCYSLFRRMGVPAPRSSYVWLTINGEDYGLYLAVEEMDAQFLDQLDMAGGNLYKPDNDSTPKIVEGSAAIPEENATESAGADLVCTDDNVNRYTDIFDNTVTEKSPDSQERVVRSLHSLSDLRDLENHLDTQEIITYFAVHNFVGNYDSYTGPKPHNYYLYESDGKLALFPWDYNLAFGAFPSDGQFGHVSDSAWVINQGIDSFGLRIGG